MINSLHDINAYILTGGQSRRLNTDKSLVQINGKTLTEITHKKLTLIFDNIYIVGKENRFTNFTFIQDIEPVQCPLNGIVTALEHNKKEWIFVFACDLPLVQTSSIINIYNNIGLNTQAVLPKVNDKLQPLCAFYHKSVLKEFNNAIAKGDYSLMKLLDQIETKKVRIPLNNEEQFLNINYAKDLTRAAELLKEVNN